MNPPPVLASRALYARLLRHVAPYRWAFVAALLGMILTAATEPALPALMKPMLDQSFVHKDPSWKLIVPLALVALFLFRGIANFISKFAMTWVGNRVVMDLRNQMFERLLQLPNRFFEDTSTGALLSKLTNDVGQVMNAVTTVITNLVTDSFVVLGLMAWLFWLNWKLTAITLIAAPIISLLVTFFNRRLRNVSRDSQTAMGALNTVADEAIKCQRVIKIFGGQSLEESRFSAVSNHLRHMQMKQTVASASFVPLVQMVAAISVAIIVWLAIEQTAKDETTVGGFVSFITAMIMLLAPLKRLSDISESLQRGLAAAESIFALIDEKTEVDRGTLDLGRARGELAFQAVTFTYPRATAPAVIDFTLHMAPGQTVALVGASGSGKTTIANLLPRFLSPSAGRITLDGHDINDITLHSLRRNIALVSQDTLLFNDSIANNIAYGALRGVSRKDMIEAARAAHVLEFIEALPSGLDTVIGENGARLSGGQRQRIAIARAILKNAPILVLDEATSALDTESERQVQAALEALMSNKTTLVIAHRLSTVEKADWIIVMGGGRVIEAGTHAQLITANGVYAKLVNLQTFEPQIQDA